jgi:hypothetical protein
MRFKYSLTVGILAAGVVAVALAQAGRELWINGKKAASAPIERNGELFVSARALRAAGAEVTVAGNRVSIQFQPPGGRNQVNAHEGVMGEFVSNDTWRVKVLSVEPAANPFTNRGPGFRVKIEVRNLANRALSLHGSGLETIQLVDDAGRILLPSGSSFTDRYTSLPPAGSFTNELVFGPQGDVETLGEPDKVLVLFRDFGGPRLQNLRIHLKQK